MRWKPFIIALTELPQARERKIDASFFPMVLSDQLERWESTHAHPIPEEIRSFMSQSNGLESQCGLMWPILPLEKWEFIHDECASAHPWIRFGETAEFRYLISLGHSPSIYRHATFGSDEEFFASTIPSYLEKVFRGEC
tara:strand:- start:294 stop:710 length:417 start_codon:yes stop_codon:yes gene_type:complete